MRTQLRFKVIASLIILSIMALVASQAYWLKNLYDSIWETTQLNIRDAMKMADYKELFLRMEAIKEAEGEGRQERIITAGPLGVSEEAEEDSSDVVDNQQVDNSFGELSELLNVLDNLENSILYNIHIVVDSLHPIAYSLYDSLMVAELKERNIHTDYTLRAIQMEDSVPFAFMQFTSTDTSAYIPINSGTYFDYPIQTQPEQFYRLYIHSPAKTVLKQMAGILVSSGLLLVLIVIAFVYLLRTILRQKTVEELKTDFTNNVTHELKTPIAVAFAANDVLLNYSDPMTEKQKKYLGIIKEQLSHLTGMVEQILTLSVENRATFKLNPEPVKVADLFPSLMEQHKLKTDKQLIFTIEATGCLTIHTDKTHLYNMLSNLIENAVKYTNKEEVRISIHVQTKGKETHISVTDNGIGISEANQKQIFDKFYRVPQGNLHNVKGYGLGLYYIKDIMTRQNGTVIVSSQPGKGSTFTLCFS